MSPVDITARGAAAPRRTRQRCALAAATAMGTAKPAAPKPVYTTRRPALSGTPRNTGCDSAMASIQGSSWESQRRSPATTPAHAEGASRTPIPSAAAPSPTSGATRRAKRTHGASPDLAATPRAMSPAHPIATPATPSRAGCRYEGKR